MTRRQKGWLQIIAGLLTIALGGWLFLRGVEDATSTTGFGTDCGFGELLNDDGACE